MEATKFIYLAIDTQRNLPIASSDNLDQLFEAVDYNFGAHKDFKYESKRVSWKPFDGDFPIECEGKLVYDAPNYHDENERDLVEVVIYTVDYFQTQEHNTTNVNENYQKNS